LKVGEQSEKEGSGECSTRSEGTHPDVGGESLSITPLELEGARTKSSRKGKANGDDWVDDRREVWDSGRD